MKKLTFITVTALFLLWIFGVTFASALDPIANESGFSGFIRPGVGYMSYKTNMVASFLGFDLSEKRIDSLTDSPDAENSAIALIPFKLAYTFASSRTELFVGTELRDLIRFDFSQQAGVKQGIGKAGVLQAGFLFSGIPAKVWKDPYVVDRNRDDTDRKSNGARLVWDRIFGSMLQLQYTYRKVDVHSEESGEFLGLSANDRGLLERDGDRHIGDVLYRFRFAKRHVLTPEFIFAKDDLDGDAMANDTYDFQLTYGYFGNPFVLTLNGYIGRSDYDERNPIYDKKQEDDRYGVGANLFYRNPWDWKLFGSNPMSFYINAAYVNIDSNIDFYDQEAIFGTVGVFFRW